MPMLQVDIRAKDLNWQAEADLHEVDLNKFRQKINWWLSDLLRHEYPSIGTEAFVIEVRRYK